MYLPHGTCYLWDGRIVWLHVVSDAIITLSYYCIPLVLMYLIRKRRDIPFNSIAWMFGLFILGCGTTHLLEIWTVWQPIYLIAGLVKAAAALISVATALILVLLLPKLLRLPSPSQLQELNEALQHEVAERKVAEAESLRLNDELEARVANRAQELAEATAALRESEERLSGVIASAMDAIVTVDAEERVVFFNRAAEKIFGCREKDAIGSSLGRFIPQRYRKAHSEHVRRFGETGISSRTMASVTELWALRADGTHHVQVE